MRFLIHHIRRNTLYLIFGIILGYLDYVTTQQLICNNRNPEGHTPRKTEGDGGFRVIVVGNHSTRGHYSPNDVYTVTIQGTKTRYSTQKFTEFLLIAESEKQSTMGQAGLVTTGIFHIIDDYHSRFSDTCPEGVQNVNMQPKTEISVLWTAPSVLVASCITFKITVVERPHVWYMDDGHLTKTLCPVMPRRRQSSRSSTYNRNTQGQSPGNRAGEANSNPVMNKDVGGSIPVGQMPPKIPPQTGDDGRTNITSTGTSATTTATVHPKLKCCACDEAKYEVRFEGVWSKDSHPKDFPENEWLLHFSDIIGASHSQDLLVWQPGETASEGLRQVAEWGATRHLENELKSKSQFINTIIKAKGLWHPNERGVTTAAFRVDKLHPLVSLVSMIGPSPDWIVGVSSHNLCLPNCTWLDEAVFDLHPYDAGTDSGITYMSPNTPTEPRQNIRPLTNSDPDDPRSPFYKVEPMQPFAKVHIRRQRIYPKNCNDTSTSSADAHEIYLTENTEDSTRPECVVSDWTAWSDCSVLCGKGIRMRKRVYVLPMKADMFRCDRQLVEKEMCLGLEPACAADNSSAFEEFESICAVTAWSDWTPCSHTCGKGTRSRTRRYKSHMGRKKCNLEMTQSEMCVISMTCDPSANGTAVDENCPMTPWSQWTPCSVTCGVGIRERHRFPLLTDENEIKEKCVSIITVQRAPCNGEFGISCQIGMDEAKQICSLPVDVGSCRSNDTQYFYSMEKSMCIPFEWSGCKGNRNRFETEAECITTCGFLRSLEPPLTSLLVENLQLLPTEVRRNSIFDESNLATNEGIINANTTELPETQVSLDGVTEPDGEDVDQVEDTKIDEHEIFLPLRSNIAQPTGSETDSEAERSTDCVVSRWEAWSHCSVSCGSGFKTRSRKVLIQAQNGGKKCPRLQKKKTCRMDPC